MAQRITPQLRAKKADPNRRPVPSQSRLRWWRGQPDEEGWWFIRPNGSSKSLVRKVELRDPACTTPALFIIGRDSMVEAETFQGMVAGPIPEPSQ